MDRHEKLAKWLDAVRAHRLWRELIPDVGTLSAYQVNGRVILLMNYRHTDGWELYLPAHHGIGVSETLDAAARYCEVSPPPVI